MAMLGMPLSSASSLIFLSAMIWFIVMSFTLYTTPYVPVRVNVKNGLLQSCLAVEHTFACCLGFGEAKREHLKNCHPSWVGFGCRAVAAM